MLRTHRQRVPAMLAVACVSMMVYAVAGAAPDDGQLLVPAETTAPAAKSDSSTPTTRKGSDTRDDDCKGSTTSTTAKDGDGKDGDGKGSTTSTTTKDDDGKSSSTTSTTRDKDDVSTNATVNAAAADKDTTATTAKGDADSDDCEPTTSTTSKGGKGTTTTTRKSGDGKDDGKNSTTTTTDRRDRPTTTTTERTVEPTTPGDPGSGGDSGGTNDPGATPIEPQEAPPFDPSNEQPVDDPGADPGVDDGGWYEMPEEGPVEIEGDEYAFGPMPAPGEAQPVIPTFSNSRSNGKPSVNSDRSTRRTRDRSGRDQQLAANSFVMSSSGAVQASQGQAQSAPVSRNLGGLQTSVTESAFPADIISTPKIFPINRRDPLAAAALVLLAGVARELFKAWRRRASDYWPA